MHQNSRYRLLAIALLYSIITKSNKAKKLPFLGSKMLFRFLMNRHVGYRIIALNIDF